MKIIKFILAKNPKTKNKHFAIKTTTLLVNSVVFNANLNLKNCYATLSNYFDQQTKCVVKSTSPQPTRYFLLIPFNFFIIRSFPYSVY